MLTVACTVHTVYVYPVVDVSAQSGCTITPINPTTLTTAGGVLASGTVNVMIQCNCTNDDSAVVNSVRWYDPDGTRLLSSTHNRYVAGNPYYSREPDDTNIVLVIPTFNDSYNGIYTCERRSGSLPVRAPNATIELTISGKLLYKLSVCYVPVEIFVNSYDGYT